ncbi:hypothetical protein PGT21_029486 [Puccinia graminis f. sp. tritici]|uniref:Uncharacterized protein n=1 Tax=Puccinia graminis f. sp. tritici TaxID=56615 RepID=A0A5B0PSD4_PUCGR|nr:hypothetical protein PGT21_029486 [Puccinia graminis f. sp. tritici]
MSQVYSVKPNYSLFSTIWAVRTTIRIQRILNHILNSNHHRAKPNCLSTLEYKSCPDLDQNLLQSSSVFHQPDFGIKPRTQLNLIFSHQQLRLTIESVLLQSQTHSSTHRLICQFNLVENFIKKPLSIFQAHRGSLRLTVELLLPMTDVEPKTSTNKNEDQKTATDN